MYFNTCKIKPYVLPVKMEEAYRLMNFKWYGPSFQRYVFGSWLYPEWIVQESTDLVVDPSRKGFADLNVVPVSYAHKVKEYVDDVYTLVNSHETTKQANNESSF